MRLPYVTPSLAALLVIAGGINGGALGKPSKGSDPSNELVGRWALVATLVDGEDVTKGGVTQPGPVRHYVFNKDKTFRITVGDSVTETGIWSTNPFVSPKIFDHTWNTGTGLGPTVPGIYELGGEVLKISILPPNTEPRPTRFESKASNGSRIYIFKRVPE